MFVIVAGGGRTGTQLASLLLAQDHVVHLIDNRPEILARIHTEIPTEAIFEGSPTEPQILEQADIGKADVVAATTDNDAENLAICFIARERYNVARTIARINNPRAAWLFDDKFHVDVSFNNADVMASLIMEEMSMGDMMTLLKLRRGRYSLPGTSRHRRHHSTWRDRRAARHDDLRGWRRSAGRHRSRRRRTIGRSVQASGPAVG